MSDAEPMGINPDLIRQYAAGASEFGITQLITLFNSLRRQEQRAAELSRAYLAQVCRLQAEVSVLRAGSPEPTVQALKMAPRPMYPPQIKTNKSSEPKPTVKSGTGAAEVSLDDL